MVDTSEVLARTDLIRQTGIAIERPVGGVEVANIADIIKVADLYSRSGVMVPPHCRDNPGTCFALCMQAHEWGMPYLAVINQSYVVTNRGVDRIAYQSMIIHAVIERNAPIKGRLRYEIIGEEDERRCKIWGTFKGEDQPHVYISEPLGKLRDARGWNDQKQIKGSPLWVAQPEVQLFYSASRQWSRIYCPDVILGAYTPEDPVYEDRLSAEEPALVRRLREAKAHGDRGFDLDHVRREAGHTVIEGDAAPGETSEEAKQDVVEHADDGRAGGDEGGGTDTPPEGASGEAGGDDKPVGEPVADESPAREAAPRASKARKRAPAKQKSRRLL